MDLCERGRACVMGWTKHQRKISSVINDLREFLPLRKAVDDGMVEIAGKIRFPLTKSSDPFSFSVK